MPGNDYRDELSAAHARIAELEEKLQAREAGKQGAEPWVAELEAKRAAIVAEGRKGLGDPKRRWKALGIVASVALLLATLCSLIFSAPAWLFFVIFGGLTIHPGMLLIFVTGKARQQRAAREIAQLEEKIADVKRMASMMGATRFRVAEESSRQAPPDEADEPASERDAASRLAR
jgi:hypothetical protein